MGRRRTTGDRFQRIRTFLRVLGLSKPERRAEPPGEDAMPISAEQMDKLRRVKTTHEQELMRKANVVGVGIGYRQQGGEWTDEPAIVVSVTRKMPRSMLDEEDVIPQELEGVPVDVHAIGEPMAFDEDRGG